MLISEIHVINSKIRLTISFKFFFKKIKNTMRKPAFLSFIAYSSCMDPFTRKLFSLMRKLTKLFSSLTIILHEIFAQIIFQIMCLSILKQIILLLNIFIIFLFFALNVIGLFLFTVIIRTVIWWWWWIWGWGFLYFSLSSFLL